MKFSDKLAKMRKANNLSQEQLADELGVTRQSVSKWESGDSYPDMAKIVQLCKVLNCTINDILDDEVVSEEKKEKTNEAKDDNKVNIIKKYFDDFLGFVTKSVNMFSHMGFKQILKMLMELFILGFVLHLICKLAIWALTEFLWSVLSYLPKVYKVVKVTITSIVGIGIFVFSVIIVCYVYKTRYLDYYVTLTDKNATKQTVEEPIEENKTSQLESNKKEKIIIRDPKHSNSKVIDGLVNVIVFICKLFVLSCAIPVIITILFAVAGLIICIIRKGIIFRSCILICLCVILLSVVILMFFYNVLFNRKQVHKLNIILIIVSLLLGGTGCGLLINNVTNITVQKENTPVKTTSEKVVLSELNKDDIIFVNTNNIEFIIDENKQDITIEFIYPTEASLYKDIIYEDSGIEYNYGININGMFSAKELLKDIEHNVISSSYDTYRYLKVIVTCNEANKAKFLI